MQHHREGMAGSPRLPTLGSPSLKPTTHNRTADDAGERVLRRPRDGLNTVRPRAPRCGRCVLTPPRTQRCSKTAGHPQKALRPKVDGPAPFRNGTTDRFRCRMGCPPAARNVRFRCRSGGGGRGQPASSAVRSLYPAGLRQTADMAYWFDDVASPFDGAEKAICLLLREGPHGTNRLLRRLQAAGFHGSPHQLLDILQGNSDLFVRTVDGWTITDAGGRFPDRRPASPPVYAPQFGPGSERPRRCGHVGRCQC
jgi:hypothetical protein